MIAPCKDCPERHELCHSSCEKYKDFVKEREEIREARRLDLDIQHFAHFNYEKKAAKRRR